MTLIPFEDAQALLLARAMPLAGSEAVPLRAACGRVLAHELTALRTQPPFAASAMDGYALRAADAPAGATLPVLGEAAAGLAHSGDVPHGACVRIFTGAPVPDWADTVLIQENTRPAGDGLIEVTEAPARLANIRPAGIDFAAGQVLLLAGTVLTAGATALAASGGHPTLDVRRKPIVAILATGDELVLPGAQAGPAQIVASNQFGIAAMVEAHGGSVMELGIAPDSIDAIGARLDAAFAAGADIIVTIGGASVGDRDLVAPALHSRGVALDFWKVAMRPGKPIMAGSKGPTHVIGLPGNPASTMVAATLFLRPLVRRLADLGPQPTFTPGRLAAAVPAGGPRADFMRATAVCDGDDPLAQVSPLPRQDSSLLSIYARATVLLYRPVDAPAAGIGEPCLYVSLD